MNRQKIIVAAIGIAVFSALGASPSLSRDYPFCRKSEAGPGDCRYDTYEQCLAAVSGTASYCQQNFWLQPSGRDIPPRRAPRN